MVKNVVESVRNRLLNLSRKSGEDFQQLLKRYIYERFLFRLSTSKFSHQFILKGGTLLSVWFENPYRSTEDIDFEWFGEPYNDHIKSVLQEIMAKEYNDGLRFDLESLQPLPEQFKVELDTKEIFRYSATVFLGTARTKFSIDIAQGGIIDPPAYSVEFPTILSSEQFKLLVLPKEIAIAEKFHAMCVHTESPSRIKDLYDVWHLIKQNDLDETVVANSMQIVFKNRNNTPLPTDIPTILSETFANSERGKNLWLNFSKRVHGVMPEFAEIRSDLRVSLMHHANLARKLDN